MATKKKADRGAPPSASEVIATLEGMANKSIRGGMARYGIPNDHALGISVGALRALGKKLGKSQPLALELWASEIYEARMLACFVGEADQLTSAQMDRMCRDFDNWAICDTLCFHLFDRSPLAWRKIGPLARRRAEFEKRTAFALLAALALHDRSAPDGRFVTSLPLVERAATDERNFVKKGVSWALRSIGHRNQPLHTAATDVATRLARSDDATARWVGKDTLRDLTRPMVVRKLAARMAASRR